MADSTTAVATAGTSASTVTGAAARIAGTSAKEMQDRFLTLLVTQMKNQDPLSPMDNSQLTSQLAQISTVTGIDQVNDTMKAVLGQIKALESMQAATMDGRDVLVPGSAIALGSGPAVGGYELPEAADGVTVSIRNAAGATVRELQLPRVDAGIHRFEWDGLAASGARAAEGAYTFTVRANAAGREIEATALARGHVAGIVRGGDEVQLDLGSLGRKPLTDVREIL